MERVMWAAQEESGGIRTDVDVHTYAVEGFTNTETTSLVLLAYDTALIQSLRSAGLQAQQEVSWRILSNLHQIIRAIPPMTLNVNTDAEVNEFLTALIDRAGSHLTSYLNQTFEDELVPAAITEITLRLAANMYNRAFYTTTPTDSPASTIISHTLSGTGMPSAERCACARDSGSPGAITRSNPGAGGMFLTSRTISSARRLKVVRQGGRRRRGWR